MFSPLKITFHQIPTLNAWLSHENPTKLHDMWISSYPKGCEPAPVTHSAHCPVPRCIPGRYPVEYPVGDFSLLRKYLGPYSMLSFKLFTTICSIFFQHFRCGKTFRCTEKLGRELSAYHYPWLPQKLDNQKHRDVSTTEAGNNKERQTFANKKPDMTWEALDPPFKGSTLTRNNALTSQLVYYTFG